MLLSDTIAQDRATGYWYIGHYQDTTPYSRQAFML